MKLNRKTISKAFALLLSFAIIFTNCISGTLAFLSINTSKVKNTFVPFDTATSDLIISKKVSHPFGKDYKIPDNISFDFKVDLGAYYKGYTVNTTRGGIKADENGSLMLSLKPDEAISLQGIDEGTLVKISEIQKGGGFAVSGEAERKVVISKNEFAKADFVNIYTPQKVSADNVTLKGTKKLSGREFEKGDSFTFVLERETEKGWENLCEQTISYSKQKGFNKFNFTDAISALSFDKIGSYAFRVSEKIGKLAGISYDKTVNYFYIHVTDNDMDGFLEISDISTEQNAKVSGNFDIEVNFNNAYTLPQDIELSIVANKKVKNSGSKAIGPENFEFALKGNAKNLTAKSDTNGKAIFKLCYGYADIGKTFEYKLSEVKGKKTGVTYSEAVYNISVSISLNDKNRLVADVIVNEKPYKDSLITFTNLYKSKLETPETGETSCLAGYLALIMFACALLVVYSARRKKTRFLKVK